MDELTAFIGARLDDDERYARLFLAIGQRLKDSPTEAVTAIGRAGVDMVLDMPEAVTEAMRWKCAAPNDLNRALREVAAKRRRLERYLEQNGYDLPEGVNDSREQVDQECDATAKAVLEREVKEDAAVYSDHPDYRAEWR